MANNLRVKRRKGERPAKRARPRSRFAALRGTRKTGMSTDEIMNLLRGYDEDARDSGFKVDKKRAGAVARGPACLPIFSSAPMPRSCRFRY